MDIKKAVAGLLACGELDAEAIGSVLAPTPDISHGDIAVPCFRFAGKLHKSPGAVAADLMAALNEKNSPLIDRAAVEGGYLNIFLRREVIVKALTDEFGARGGVAIKHEPNNKTICIDYSSINIAKPFHIGHLLTTAIGGSLYRIFGYLGYNVVGINHLGDWGTQFGKLIAAYLRWGDDEDIEKRGVRALLDIYVRFHAEAEKDPALEDEGRAWFKKIEEGDVRAHEIFEKFKTITLREVSRVYDRLGIVFDSYAGESFYADKVGAVVSELKEKGLLTESEGAEVVDLSAYDMPPCIIVKSDGASIYATRDLAAAEYRKRTYDFCKCLYVVAYQQNLHFRQVFKVLELMGKDWAKDCVHVPFGMVSLEGQGALSTRKGNVVFLEDVLDAASAKALAVIESKNPNLEHKKEVAEKVGVGAVLFGALGTSRIKDLVFSLDKALSFEGDTAPYLQYTHARCRSILEKAGATAGELDCSVLTDNDSFTLAMRLGAFDGAVQEAADKYEPSVLARYLLDLAKAFNQFYLNCRIIGESTNVAASRLKLVGYTAETLQKGLELLLINAPDKM